MVTSRVNDLEVNSFPMMFHILVYLKLFFNIYMIKGLRFEMVKFHMPMSDHGDIQNLCSPSQELSNDVSYVGLSEAFLISTCVKFWGLRWYNFTRECRIMVIFRIYNLQVKNFHWCILSWFIWNIYILYIFVGLRFEMVYIHMRMSDHGDIQNL